MKTILAGYEGSKAILKKSSYLLNKYLPFYFDVYWLNYGEYYGNLYKGSYINLDKVQEGGSASWSRYIREYLEKLSDELVIFSLDDYLLSDYINLERYRALVDAISEDKNIACARLCISDFYNYTEFMGNELIMLGNMVEYSVTTQYCIWRREVLIDILSKINTPWEFEIAGSNILNASGKKVIGSIIPALKYNVNSSLSSKWEGVDYKDVSEQDLETIKDL